MSEPPTPEKMTIAEFTRWRIARELQAGREVLQIAKSLGISRWSVWRVASRCNLQQGDNSDDIVVDE